MVLLLGDTSGLAEGITGAGSALGHALGQRNLLQKQEEQKREQFSNLASILEGTEVGPEATPIKSALVQALQQGVDPNALMQQFALLGKIGDKSPSVFQKKLQEKSADIVAGVIEEKGKVQSMRGTIDRLKDLSENLRGSGGLLKSIIGTQEATEFNALGLAAIEPVLKIFNPRGVIPQAKIEMLKGMFVPKASELFTRQQGKIQALERFADAAEKKQQEIEMLFDVYGDNIPPEVLLKYEQDSEALVDNFISSPQTEELTGLASETSELPQASKKNKGARYSDDEGNIWISTGTEWIKMGGSSGI